MERKNYSGPHFWSFYALVGWLHHFWAFDRGAPDGRREYLARDGVVEQNVLCHEPESKRMKEVPGFTAAERLSVVLEWRLTGQITPGQHSSMGGLYWGRNE